LTGPRLAVQSIGLAGLIGILACSPAVLFEDRGTGNGASVPFRVTIGALAIDYAAIDREPSFGCEFGVQLMVQGPDPLAPGRVLASTPVTAVKPGARISGRLTSPVLGTGEYFLAYLGNKPCDWTVTVSRA